MAKRRPSGDGMVRKREDGRWEGRIVVGHKADGDSIFRYIYADTQKELTAKLRQNIDLYQGIDLTEQSKMTLTEWLEQWLGQMSATLRPSTLEHYRKDMENHVVPQLGAKMLTQVTAADLRKLYDTLKRCGRKNPRPGQSLGLSSTTVHNIHATLHQALRAALEQGFIPRNPADEVEPPKIIRQPMKILNEEQLDTFMGAIEADPIWHDFFYTELTTGLRLGEICGLMWTDFDGKAGTLQISRTLHKEKGGRLVAGDTKTYAGTRKIVLPHSTAELLQIRKKASFSPWIFHDPLRPEVPVNPKSAYHQLKKLLAQAGLPNIRFHDLRHTFSSHALASGVDAKTLSGILGHTKASFTLDTYTHTTSDMHRRAADIVGGFLTDYLGEEMKPWQNAENGAREAST
ncbi:MAG: site-specific integrase [Oscillospiraceae bacterium]|jgi:integrase|nr:site-specific integrase [Oscillospiraceae bacterium]